MNPQHLYETLVGADEVGIRLEMVMGEYTWEFHPSPLHAGTVGDIERSIVRGQGRDNECGCFTIQDAYLKFKDGSFKRPDIAVYCDRPHLTQDALEVIPEAVVEVVSPGSEKKDLEVGPIFYLAQGVKDVVVVDPRTAAVFHFRRDGTRQYASKVTLDLECGCCVTA